MYLLGSHRDPLRLTFALLLLASLGGMGVDGEGSEGGGGICWYRFRWCGETGSGGGWVARAAETEGGIRDETFGFLDVATSSNICWGQAGKGAQG